MKKDMPHVLASMSRRRTILVAWLAAWMLAVPLVHVHPEADHHHGESNHVHGGVTHTVISSDLPCEYGSASEGPVASPADHHGHLPVVGQSAHVFDHPEVAFSLLTSSPDRDTGKPTLVSLVLWGAEGALIRLPRAFAAAHTAESPTSVILSASLSPRAPPLSAV